MAARKATDEQIRNALRKHGGVIQRVANELGIRPYNITTRARRMGLEYNHDRGIHRKYSQTELEDAVELAEGNVSQAERYLGLAKGAIKERLGRRNSYASIQAKASAHLEVLNGTVLIGSDIHIWPGVMTTAMIAFAQFIERMQPAAVILNGDVIDGAAISHWPPNVGTTPPRVIQELDATADYLDELVRLSPNAKHIWTWGNHDARFERGMRERTNDDYKDVWGTELHDHFPEWTPASVAWINEGAGRSPVKVIHAETCGVHATHKNVLATGMHTVTGHLHNLKITGFDDEWGTRYGVDCGMLANPRGPQFDYMQGRARNWRSGFIVLTFVDGHLMAPEAAIVRSLPGYEAPNEATGIQWRGRIIEV